MSKTTYLGLVLIMFWCQSCSSNNPFAPESPKTQYIALGNGGGFTGKTTTYYILNSGQVYKGSEFSNEFSEIGKIDKNLVKQQWSNYDNLNLSKKQINEPGNYYYFLEFRNNDNQTRMVWQELGQKDATIGTIFSILNNSINTIITNNKEVKS